MLLSPFQHLLHFHIFVLVCFTCISKDQNKYYGHYINSRLLYFQIIKTPETNIIAIIFVQDCFTFIKEPRTNIKAIIFAMGCVIFIYQRARNKYYDHYMLSGLLYFHLSKSMEKILWPLYLFRIGLPSYIREPGI